MRWKAQFFLNNNEKNKEKGKLGTFGFKSKHHPGQMRELEHFQEISFVSERKVWVIQTNCLIKDQSLLYVKKFLLSNYKSND